MSDTLQRIYAAKAAVLDEEIAREPYESLRGRALARKGERRNFLAALERAGGAGDHR